MEGNKVYIYGLLDSNDNIVYIGKSSSPYSRLSHHKSTFGYRKMVILDFFYDKEAHYIQKYLKQGVKLVNKEMNISYEDRKIGEIIEINNVLSYQMKCNNTGYIYKSLKELEEKTGITSYYAKQIIEGKTIPGLEHLIPA